MPSMRGNYGQTSGTNIYQRAVLWFDTRPSPRAGHRTDRTEASRGHLGLRYAKQTDRCILDGNVNCTRIMDQPIREASVAQTALSIGSNFIRAFLTDFEASLSERANYLRSNHTAVVGVFPSFR